MNKQQNGRASITLESGRISANQLAILFYLSILTTGILTAPSPIYNVAGRDLWISSLAGFIPACGVIAIVHALHRKFPGQTFMEYVPKIFGKTIGMLVGCVLLLFILHITGIVVRQFSEFMLVGFFKQTPLIIIASTIVLTSSFAVRAGVEVIGRFAQLAVPIVLVLLLLVILPLGPDMDFHELLPVLENGIGPSLKGALLLQQWFLMYALIAFYLPYVADNEHVQRKSLLSITILMVSVIAGHLATVMMLGETTNHYNFSFITLSRYIQVASFFEHLQSFVMAIWVIGLFVRLCMTYYILVLGASQLLGLKDYRILILPAGIGIIVFSIWSMPGLAGYSSALAANTFYYILMLAGLPVLTWAVSWFRSRLGNSGEQ